MLGLGTPNSDYELIQNVIPMVTQARHPKGSDTWLSEGNLLILRGGMLSSTGQFQPEQQQLGYATKRNPRDFYSSFIPSHANKGKKQIISHMLTILKVPTEKHLTL